ncbi:hypothetical protein [Rhodopila sp.]|uniref:hypothetical protein n=1 Tax=Rhodopila sp. TaxID=2480087 RepID=UPI003D0D17AB
MAKPHTHKLVVTYRSGRTETHTFPSFTQADKERAGVIMVPTVVSARIEPIA